MRIMRCIVTGAVLLATAGFGFVASPTSGAAELPAPVDVRVTDVSFTTAHLTWDSGLPDDFSHINTISIDGGERVFNVAGVEETDLRQLAPGTMHTVEVFNTVTSDEVSPGVKVSFTTFADITAPAAPTNFQVSFQQLDPKAPDDAVFTWTPATDNSGEAQYELYRDGQATPFLVTFFDAESAIRYNLRWSLGDHTVVVRARDRAGNLSGASNILTIAGTG